jgi:60 kDa SS-A/Ro ribonucleoprotein
MANSTYSQYSNSRKSIKTATPQSKKASPKQKKNAAGGYTFVTSNWQRLDRFLIIGSDAPTYYIGKKALTTQNVDNLASCVKEDGVRVVNRIVEISDSGRALKNDPALFALAFCASSDNKEVKKAALSALPKIARTGTHLLHFVDYVEGFRGWGRSLSQAIADWYTSKKADSLAYQVVKYQSRDGWSQKDVIKLAHPKTDDPAKDAVIRWIISGMEGCKATERTFKDRRSGKQITQEIPRRDKDLPELIVGFEKAKKASKDSEIVKLIRDYKLPREAVPTEFLNSIKVWDVLLQDMPLTALTRNLAKMTSIGLIEPGSDAAKLVVSKLSDQDYIKQSRLHPMAILVALRMYARGHGEKGSLSWKPVTRVIDVLDAAFYKAYGNVTPTGKSLLLSLDVSGSMGSSAAGTVLKAREAAAAMALVTANVEQDYEIVGFSHELIPLEISPRQRLNDAVEAISNIPFGATDCALPMLWALGLNSVNRGGYSYNNGYKKVSDRVKKFDAFCIYTDNETYIGQIHPHEALKRYRKETGINAKLVTAAVTASGSTIADPNDPGMLDIVGFDAELPNLISSFISE